MNQICHNHLIMQKITRISKEEVEKLNAQNKKFRPQQYEDIPNLASDAPQVMSRQATLNIGTVGHVAHGKSTVVRAVSGVNTVKFRQERVRNITIRLGYANAKIFKCPTCPAPDCYKSYPSDKEDDPKCDNKDCESTLVLQRHISFCDCPGHEVFLSTMLTGAAVMDAALLLIAANVDCPQPQTIEHLMALEIMKLDHMIILQNKIDIIFKDAQKTRENYKQIKQFMKGSICKNSPIIPISAEQRYNIDAVCQSICDIPIPKRNLNVAPKMIIIRSFDVNKPGTNIQDLQGGVVGGSVLEGVLQVGMDIELRPGHMFKDADDNVRFTPIRSRIVSLMAQNNPLLYAVPGGLIAVGLMIDPSITRNDRMVGNVLGVEGHLPDIFVEIDIQFSMLKKAMSTGSDKKPLKITKIVGDQTLKFNVGSTETPGKVLQVYDDIMKIKLNSPICTKVGEKVAFSRRIDKKFRLIGYGTIKKGEVLAPTYDEQLL